MKLSDSLFRWRLPVLLLTALVSIAAFPGVLKLNISVDIKDFFIEGDPILEKDKEFRELFSNNDFIGVLVENGDVFSPESLELIREIGTSLEEAVPLAEAALSIAALEDFPLGGPSLEFSEEGLLSDEAAIESVRQSYSTIPSIGGTLFSEDYSQAWILLPLQPYPEGLTAFELGEIAYAVIEEIDSGNSTLTATGVPVYAYRKESEMMGDLIRVLIFGALAALILSIVIIRSFQGIIGSLMVIGLSVLWAFGLQGWMGTTIDSALISVPMLLTMGVSIGYTVHITRFFTLYFRKTGHRKDSVLYGIKESGKPIIFTAFTTIAAMLSFALVEIKPIRWVGLTSATAILNVCILTLLVYPFILSLGKEGKKTEPGREKKAVFESMLSRFSLWTETYEKNIMVIFLSTVVVAVFGVMRLEIDFDAVKMMGTRLPHMQDQVHIGNSDIASSETIDLVLEFPAESLKQREVLTALDDFETLLLEEPAIKGVMSLNRLVKEFYFLKNKKDPEYFRLPEKDSTIRGLLTFYNRIAPEILESWTDEEMATTRVFIELKDFSSREIAELTDNIERLLPGMFPTLTDYYFSGSTYQMAMMNQRVTSGLIRSVLTALLMITALLIILFKSLKLGLIAMIPNLYPILIVGAIMGYAGIPMEFVTMTVAPMIMGLAVDDTIHLISHIKKDLLKTGDSSISIRCTFSTVGTAITETTAILCLTFLVFLVSDVNSVRHMGLLSFSGMLAAYLADIFITPILIKRIKINAVIS